MRMNWTGIDSQRCAHVKPDMAPGTVVAFWSGSLCHANFTLLQAATTRQYLPAIVQDRRRLLRAQCRRLRRRSCGRRSEFGRARGAAKPGLATERTPCAPHGAGAQLLLSESSGHWCRRASACRIDCQRSEPGSAAWTGICAVSFVGKLRRSMQRLPAVRKGVPGTRSTIRLWHSGHGGARNACQGLRYRRSMTV